MKSEIDWMVPLNPMASTEAWKRSEFEIRCKNSDKTVIKGIIYGAFSIHKDSGEYVLSHLPTGCKVSGFSTQKLSRETAEKLSALGDWSIVRYRHGDMEFLVGNELRAGAAAIVKEYKKKDE